MIKNNKQKEEILKVVRAVNKNVRCSTRKLKPILKSMVGKKVDLAYFARGEEDLNNRKYELHYGGNLPPFYDEEFYKTVVFELPK